MNIHEKLYDLIKNNVTLKFIDIGKGDGKLDKGVLPPEKGKEFIQSLQKPTILLSDSRYVKMQSDTFDIDRINYDLDLEDGTRNQDTAQIKLKDQDPVFALNEMIARKLMAKTRLTTDAIEDSIAQKTFASTLMSLFGQAAGRSLERIFIYGNKNLTPSENVPSGYTQIDGWIRKAKNVIKDFPNNKIEPILTKMYDTLDPSYLSTSKFYVPTSRESEYRRALQHRNTSLGDESVTKNNTLLFEGIPVVPVPALDIPVRDPVFRDNISSETLFLGRPSNFVHGLHREITIKSAEDIENDLFKFVLSLRGDCHFEDETKVVIAQPEPPKPEPQVQNNNNSHKNR